MKKFLITLAIALIFSCLFVIGVSAKELYLEEIPDDLKIPGEAFTHFLVIDGEEYYGGADTKINTFNTTKIEEEIAKLAEDGGALNQLGYTAADLGTKFLTKLVFPTTLNGTTVLNVDINNNKSFKTQTYFKNCGYLQYPPTVKVTNDGNECNYQIRCIDFGENSQLVNIPAYFMLNAKKLIRIKNMPQNLIAIGTQAFRNCSMLQGDENKRLNINAEAVGEKAFDCAMTNIEAIIFGENVLSMYNESFSNAGGVVGVKYIEFKCDVTKVTFPANATTVNHTGSFYFGINSSQRAAYSNLKCIILSNPAQADCDGKTFIEASGQDVFFRDTVGDKDIVYTSHDMQSVNDCMESCSRCQLTQLKANPNHSWTYTFLDENGNEFSYLSQIYVHSSCSVCETNILLETIDKIFTPLGFSVEESGSTGGVFHKVKINHTSLARYEELSQKTLNYGVVAGCVTSTSTGDLIEFGVDGASSKEGAVVFDFSKTSFNFIELKLTNINKSVSVYCNAYVYDGSNITYICGETESSLAIAKAVTIEAIVDEE